jgi:hypothetical protein
VPPISITIRASKIPHFPGNIAQGRTNQKGSIEELTDEETTKRNKPQF